MEKVKELLNEAYLILESINWQNQTLNARTKWVKAKALLNECNHAIAEFTQ